VGDRFGNTREPSAGELDVMLDGPRGVHRLHPRALRGHTDARPADDDASSAPMGMSELTEELQVSGHYRLNATVLGEHVSGSPIELHVCPAPPDGEHSILVPPPSPAIAHEVATFVVQPRDKWGNPPPSEDLEQAVALGAVVARVDGPTRPKCAVRARGDGSLDVSVLAQLSGDYRLHVWVGGSQLPSCPFPLRVYANHSLASSGLEVGADNERRGRNNTSPPRAARNATADATTRQVERSPRATTLDGGSMNSSVFSPRGVFDAKPPSPPRTVVSSASWAARHPTTPRARTAAFTARSTKNAPASPRTEFKKPERTACDLSHSASAPGSLRTPQQIDRARAQIAARAEAFERHDWRSPGTLRSPQWATLAPREERPARRQYGPQIAARGGPTSPRSPRSRATARSNFWGGTDIH